VQRQLHSVLATLVKLSRWDMVGHDDQVMFHTAAAGITWALLDAAVDNQHEQQRQQQQQLLEPAAGAAAGGKFSFSSGSADAAAMLPSVVILGRCCMMWAEHCAAQSQQLQQQQEEEEESCSNQEEQQDPNRYEEQQQVPLKNSDDEAMYVELDQLSLLSVMQRWLAAGSTCDQLVAAGYDPLPVQQQLPATVLATETLLGTECEESHAVRLAAAQQVLSTGLALCSFAVPCMCNNPVCTSMAGPSELAAVSGRSCICAGCCVARYCGRACQRAAWKQHKPVCGALSAAAAAGATG
jgi:hypothetical protein